MNRILLMVVRNFWKVPGYWFKLCHYAKYTDKYPEAEKYGHIQKIMKIAVESGNIDMVVTGTENIPMEGGLMMYSNHQGLFDILAAAATCPRPWGAVLKKELYGIPFMKQIVDCSYSFPMDRDDIKQSLEVMQKVIKEVKGGRNYLIYPEGTRSKKQNEMLEFHSGSFRCAIKSKCPVIPIAMIDSYKVLDQKGSKPVKVQLHYLEPIKYEEYKDMNTTELAALVRSRIEAAIKKYSE